MATHKHRFAALLLGLVILCTTALSAHESGKHFVGNVKSVDATSLTLITTNNETVTLKLLPNTKYVSSSGQPSSLQDFKTGDRVIVHAKPDGTGWDAQEVDHSGTAAKH